MIAQVLHVIGYLAIAYLILAGTVHSFFSVWAYHSCKTNPASMIASTENSELIAAVAGVPDKTPSVFKYTINYNGEFSEGKLDCDHFEADKGSDGKVFVLFDKDNAIVAVVDMRNIHRWFF